MKFSSLLFIAISLFLCSCNNNDDPSLEIALPIDGTFIPASVDLNLNQIDEEQRRNIILLTTNEHIINDASELPVDPIGFSETFKEIDFSKYTLLIKYVLHDYSIDTYSNSYYRNTRDNSYNWTVNIGTTSDTGINNDVIYLTRFAIYVNKIPADAQVISWFSLKEIKKTELSFPTEL